MSVTPKRVALGCRNEPASPRETVTKPKPEVGLIAPVVDAVVDAPLTPKIGRAVLGLALGLAVAFGAAWFLGVDPAEVTRNLRGVSPWTIVGCVASGFVVLALQSLRWFLVMKPLLGLSYRQAFFAQLIAFTFNAVLPARGGDLLRVQYLGRETGKSRATILGREAVDRWLDWSAWFPLLLVFSLTGSLPRWLYVVLGSFSALLVAWALAMAVMSRRRYTPREGSRLGALYGAFRSGVEAFRSWRTLLIALSIAPLPWLWESIVLVLLGRAFGFELSLGKAFSVLIGFNIAMVVPSPGAVGTVEAGGTAALVVFGVDQSKALAYMFVYHFSYLVPGVAAGVTALVIAWERLFRPKKTF